MFSGVIKKIGGMKWANSFICAPIVLYWDLYCLFFPASPEGILNLYDFKTTRKQILARD